MPDWYGFAIADYKNPSGWETALTRAEKWKFNAHRLHFYFQDNSGTLIPRATLWTQLDACLAVISNHNAQAILNLHNWGAPTGYVNVLVGSQDWFNEWLALVDHFKNDSRVIAWEIYNEAFPNYLDASHDGDGTSTNTTAKIEGLMKAQYDLSTQIRAIDPNRPIVWFANYAISSSERYTPLDSPVTHTD